METKRIEKVFPATSRGEREATEYWERIEGAISNEMEYCVTEGCIKVITVYKVKA